MSNLPNIIQRRDLEPLLHKAARIAKHYEKAANCTVSVLTPECSEDANLDRAICHDLFNNMCRHCNVKKKDGIKGCALMHIDAVKKTRESGGSHIYVCKKGKIFWTSPFYSGERFAGALLARVEPHSLDATLVGDNSAEFSEETSGNVQNSLQSSDKIKALANMMLICAGQISGLSYVQKNMDVFTSMSVDADNESDDDTVSDEIVSDESVSSIDLERTLMADFRRGDNTKAIKLLLQLLNTMYREVKYSFPAFRLKAIELAVLLSRATTNPDDINDDSVIEANSRYLMKIKKSTSIEEIEAIISDIAYNMSGRIFSFHGVRHFPALRKAERFIWENYTRKISLQEIANASGLSAPYFSTIFKEEMGENLSDYLNRLRVEKATVLLLTTNLPINEIARICGFEDQSWFSKIFKNNTGFTPGKYRDQPNHQPYPRGMGLLFA